MRSTSSAQPQVSVVNVGVPSLPALFVLESAAQTHSTFLLGLVLASFPLLVWLAWFRRQLWVGLFPEKLAMVAKALGKTL